MNLKNFLVKSGIIMVLIIIGVIVVILLFWKKVNFELFLSGTGIESVDEIEYVSFHLGDETEEYATNYYITDRVLIEKIYDIFNRAEYSKCNIDYMKNYKAEKLYGIRFGQALEENRNLGIYGYAIEEQDTLTVMPIVQSNYGSVESGEWEDVIKGDEAYIDTNMALELQKFCESELTYITMDEIETIIEEDDNIDIFDFYGYLHEKTDVHNPCDEPAEKLYQVNRLEIADDDGYLEVKNQYMTVYDEDAEKCKWYRDVLSVSLFNKDGELREVLYEKDN